MHLHLPPAAGPACAPAFRIGARRRALALVLLLACPGLAGAVSDPRRGIGPSPRELAALVAGDGPIAVARQLTDHGAWGLVGRMIEDGPGSSSGAVASLMKAAPPSAVPGLRSALRRRLLAAPVETIAMLDPVRDAAFNGARVCASADPAWRRRAIAAIASTHDVIHALQRIDCRGALGVAKPARMRQR